MNFFLTFYGLILYYFINFLYSNCFRFNLIFRKLSYYYQYYLLIFTQMFLIDLNPLSHNIKHSPYFFFLFHCIFNHFINLLVFHPNIFNFNYPFLQRVSSNSYNQSFLKLSLFIA